MKYVVDPVVKIVILIRARRLTHKQFMTLLDDCNPDHSGVPYHTTLRWLSLGKVLGPKNANSTSFGDERER